MKNKNIPHQHLKELVKNHLQDSIELLNANITPETTVKLINATVGLLESTYNGFNALDIEKTFSKGQSGEFGETYGMNIQTIGKWLKGYNSKIRQPQLKNYLGSMAGQPQDQEPSDVKEKRIYSEILQDLKQKFNEYKNDSFDFNNIQLNISFYNTLDYFGHITITADQKNKILEGFIQKVKEKHKGLGERGAIFKEFMIQAMPGNPFYNEAIFYCKEYVFKEYIKSRKNKNLDLI